LGEIIDVYRRPEIELFHHTAFIGTDGFIADHHFYGNLDNFMPFCQKVEPAVPFQTGWRFYLCRPGISPAAFWRARLMGKNRSHF
jgi:hypothetical protein